MTTATKKQNARLASDILENHREKFEQDRTLVLIKQQLGKGATDYYQVLVVYNSPDYPHPLTSSLTWAMSVHFGYSIRDRNGQWYLAIDGGNFSKSDELARTLALFYGVERVRYEVL